MQKKMFEEEYFSTGNYANYRQRKFDGLAQDLIQILPIRPIDRIIDFGSGVGGLIYSLKKERIHNIHGTDLSTWAIEWGRQQYGLSVAELQYYNRNLLCEDKDWLIALDVFEHCPNGELESILDLLNKYPPLKGLVVRIPVSAKEGEDFVLEVSRNDRTHVQIHSKTILKNIFKQYGFEEKVLLNTKHIYDSEGVYCAVFKHVDKNAEVCIHCRVVHGSGPVCEAA